MPRVDKLFLSTDFDTLKSDDSKTTTITITGGAGVAAGATATYSSTINVGQAESMIAAMANNSIDQVDGSYVALSVPLRSDRTGSAPYSIVLRYSHLSGNTVRFVASIYNNSASPLTLSATSETFTIIVRTFRVPKFA
jgi:hypothetical protein